MTGKLRKIIIASVLVLLLIGAVITASFLFHEHEIERIRAEKIEEAYEKLGTYDEKSIVLQNTTYGEAKALADKLGAELRITKDGKFATLTLKEDTNVISVLEDRDNRENVERFSLDYEVMFTDFDEGSDDSYVPGSLLRTPSRPDYNVSDDIY